MVSWLKGTETLNTLTSAAEFDVGMGTLHTQTLNTFTSPAEFEVDMGTLHTRLEMAQVWKRSEIKNLDQEREVHTG